MKRVCCGDGGRGVNFAVQLRASYGTSREFKVIRHVNYEDDLSLSLSLSLSHYISRTIKKEVFNTISNELPP